MADQMTIALHHVAGSVSEAAIRHHRVAIDRPLAKGGSDAGPMGGELFLASVGGCFMSNLLAAIKAREAPVNGVQLEVTGTMESAPARFTGIDLAVTSDCRDRELIEKLVQIAERSCIMVNTLRDKLELRVRVAG